jgi:hypothetical protein
LRQRRFLVIDLTGKCFPERYFSTLIFFILLARQFIKVSANQYLNSHSADLETDGIFAIRQYPNEEILQDIGTLEARTAIV